MSVQEVARTGVWSVELKSQAREVQYISIYLSFKTNNLANTSRECFEFHTPYPRALVIGSFFWLTDGRVAAQPCPG